MKKRKEILKIVCEALEITFFDEADEKEFWLSRTPAERLAALELLRQMTYDYEPNSVKLQRVFEIIERK